MLKIEGKTFMNIQEAVQWLLDNNALPFQSSANYQANTEIGLGTVVNPSPAKVRIGSIIFFADSKVSTVVGITETGFICSDKYNNLVDDIAYVTNIVINASGHLITTLSDGQTIDAGIIKQVSGLSINASQHLIVTYNDGTTTDLGAIFSGNVIIDGDLTVTGEISGKATSVYDGSISPTLTDLGLTVVTRFVKTVRNFNELQFIFNCRLANNTGASITIGNDIPLAYYGNVPTELKAKIYAHNGNDCSTGSQGPIAMTLLLVATTGGQVNSAISAQLPKYVDLYHTSGQFVFYIEGGAFEVSANTTYDFEARISLAL